MDTTRKFVVKVDFAAGEVQVKEVFPQKRGEGGRFLDTGKGRNKPRCKFFTYCPFGHI